MKLKDISVHTALLNIWAFYKTVCYTTFFHGKIPKNNLHPFNKSTSEENTDTYSSYTVTFCC